ncbi:MAG TPA: GPP34 family phosphoprotein [Thermoleophilaceae bacterium]|nr:GPP34 family phosphoprotein [Thermoleophilaceae bacterium]
MLTIPEEALLAQARPFGRDLPDPQIWLREEPLAAGRLIELILSRRIAAGSTRGRLLYRETVRVVDATPTGDPLLDETLESVGADDRRTCAHWVKRLANGSRDAYLDRLVKRSLLRRDERGSDPKQYVADADALAAIIERIRAVLEQPPAADLRDAALVTLLGYAGALFPILNELRWNPSALIGDWLARRQLDQAGRRAIELYTNRAAGDWELAAADGIRMIAFEAEPEGWTGGG